MVSPVNANSDARQQPGAAVAGHDAHLDVALGKLRLFGGNAQVAHAGQVQAGADGVAIDCGDHRHPQVEQRQRQLLDAAPGIRGGSPSR
jgi:hypothetical protein